MYKVLLFLFICVFFLAACKQNAVILPDGTAVKVEVAITPEQAERGLMFRENLPENQGMLFIFDKDDMRLFWMKNTLIDLDMIFIDSENKIVFIAPQVPHSYLGAPEEEITQVLGFGKYVLEVNSGFAKKHNLKQGDRLVLKIK